MSGLPIDGWSDLLKAINLLKNDWIDSTSKVYRKYTWTNFKLPLKQNEPTKIVDLPEGDDYQIILNNKSGNYIYLYLGEDGKDNLRVDNSAWELKPNFGMAIEQSEGTLWGI